MRKSTQVEIVLTAVVIVIILGTLAYHALEGWGYIDSFYFTGITITTIGYGDMHPTTAMSKIFTVFFAFTGVGVSLFALSILATSYFERRERKMGILIQQNLLKNLKKSFNGKNLKKKRRAIISGSG
jgi:hypothetical protein